MEDLRSSRVDGGTFRLFVSVRQSPTPSSPSSVDVAEDLDAALAKSSSDREPARFAHMIGCRDPLLYIYTSGTTGLPKAVVIKHLRWVGENNLRIIPTYCTYVQQRSYVRSYILYVLVPYVLPVIAVHNVPLLCYVGSCLLALHFP